MIHITEAQSARIVSHELAFRVVRQALIDVIDPDSVVFPAVLGHGSNPINRFSLKSSAAGGSAGVKIGFNWLDNKQRGVPHHNSVIILFDQQRAGIAAVIEAEQANAYRTSAANAVATDALARRDAKVLGLFGTGQQAFFECQAVAQVRTLERVCIARSEDAAKQAGFCERLHQIGLQAEILAAHDVLASADIVVTATPSRAPLFDAAWVRPGTHVSSMGADGKGKHELPRELLARARLFCDLPAQSLAIGEFQPIGDETPRSVDVLTAIGAVLSGQATGRVNETDITIFDSSGISIQDLYMGQEILRLFQAA